MASPGDPRAFFAAKRLVPAAQATSKPLPGCLWVVNWLRADRELAVNWPWSPQRLRATVFVTKSPLFQQARVGKGVLGYDTANSFEDLFRPLMAGNSRLPDSNGSKSAARRAFLFAS
jgi:hypothetical protein